jgi:glycopeptide antibiotics resistance protein
MLICLIVAPWRGIEDHSHWGNVRWVPFVSPPVRVRDVVGNVMLFVPFGYSWRRAGGGIWWCLAFATVLSVGAESVQLFSHTRVPSVADIVFNVAGALIGSRRWALGSSPPGP